ncbi:unnamed protein product, partial [Ectocarpus sp. 12 AP-2014]
EYRAADGSYARGQRRSSCEGTAEPAAGATGVHLEAGTLVISSPLRRKLSGQDRCHLLVGDGGLVRF